MLLIIFLYLDVVELLRVVGRRSSLHAAVGVAPVAPAAHDAGSGRGGVAPGALAAPLARLGWKLLSCSQVKSLVKQLTWLLIGCLETKDQSGAKLGL